MPETDFSANVELRRLPAPGDNPALLAELNDGKNEGSLGNLVEWISTGVTRELRPFHQLVLADGSVLDHDAIENLARTPEFAAWVDKGR